MDTYTAFTLTIGLSNLAARISSSIGKDSRELTIELANGLNELSNDIRNDQMVRTILGETDLARFYSKTHNETLGLPREVFFSTYAKNTEVSKLALDLNRSLSLLSIAEPKARFTGEHHKAGKHNLRFDSVGLFQYPNNQTVINFYGYEPAVTMPTLSSEYLNLNSKVLGNTINFYPNLEFYKTYIYEPILNHLMRGVAANTQAIEDHPDLQVLIAETKVDSELKYYISQDFGNFNIRFVINDGQVHLVLSKREMDNGYTFLSVVDHDCTYGKSFVNSKIKEMVEQYLTNKESKE